MLPYFQLGGYMASYKDPCAVCPCYEVSGDICTLAVQGMQCKYIEVNKVVNDLMEERDAKYKRTQINDSTAVKKARME